MSINTINITSPEALRARVNEMARRSEDVKSRLAHTLKHLWNPERELVQVADTSVFNMLKNRFPNFSEVLDLWEASALALNQLGLPFESQPVLLVGEPGLGKTFFANEAAKLMQLPFYEVSMATSTAGFVLAGGSVQWAEGTVGFVAKSLSESKVANPIMLIDELDKASAGSRYDPLGPLYPLLESHSAKRFKDEALELEINASKVIWVGTANDVQLIPLPIQSRMRICQISRPEGEQIQKVVSSVYRSFIREKPYGKLLDPKLNEDTLTLLSKRSPREVKRALDEASIKVIRDGRSMVMPDDIPNPTERRVSYGFI